MKYCKLGSKMIPVNKFEKIKDSIFSLFSHKEEELIKIYKNSLNILYKKAHDSDFIVDKHLYPIETACLREKQLIEDDNTLEYDVEVFINYLIGSTENNALELLDKPIYIVEIPLIQVDTAYENFA